MVFITFLASCMRNTDQPCPTACLMYWFSVDALASNYNLRGLEQQIFFSRSSRSQTPKAKQHQGNAPSGGFGGEFIPCLFYPLVAAGIAYLVFLVLTSL